MIIELVLTLCRFIRLFLDVKLHSVGAMCLDDLFLRGEHVNVFFIQAVLVLIIVLENNIPLRWRPC